jgi:predicted secreted protein
LIKTPVGVPPVGNQAGTLTIRFPSVAIDDANALELIVDGIVNTAAGHVRFTPAGTAPVQVDYLMSVYGC